MYLHFLDSLFFFLVYPILPVFCCVLPPIPRKEYFGAVAIVWIYNLMHVPLHVLCVLQDSFITLCMCVRFQSFTRISARISSAFLFYFRRLWCYLHWYLDRIWGHCHVCICLFFVRRRVSLNYDSMGGAILSAFQKKKPFLSLCIMVFINLLRQPQICSVFGIAGVYWYGRSCSSFNPFVLGV